MPGIKYVNIILRRAGLQKRLHSSDIAIETVKHFPIGAADAEIAGDVAEITGA